MKRTLLLSLFLLVLCLSALGKGRAADEYRIMTCNIRITGLDDDAPYPERVWENRRDLCVGTVLKRKPDVICLQEVIYDSYAYFKEKCKDYMAFGFEGPEMDPYTEGYHFIGKNVILFSKKRFEFVSAGGYWLSEEPLIGGSVSWDTNRARHCNWVRVRDRKTGKEMRFLDTHLDHKVDSARREQVKIIVKECAQYAEDFPQVLCGDFNSGLQNYAIQYLHAQPGWREMYESMHGMGEAGFSAHAFNGVDYKPKRNRRIDFIFYRGGIEVLDAQYVKDHVGRMYPSDHFFIQADFKLR
ncbi:MAG: endonuclease/exonuclease/phosphatase family protein [Bacteroidaceae bacterium]|nr:endonuclease/exonuclease/phosphatase family protein [Bacteroidaceae bacterium]